MIGAVDRVYRRQWNGYLLMYHVSISIAISVALQARRPGMLEVCT